MTQHKIQNLKSLEEEMRAVARGEKTAPQDAAQPSFNSAEALIRLLTPQNRQLLSIIRDKHPQSIAELSDLTGRAPSNLTRTLSKLESAGFVKMELVNNRKVPTPTIYKLHLEIDPYSLNDQLELV